MSMTLKVGDKIAVKWARLGGYRIHTIERVTKTQYVCEFDKRFRRSEGPMPIVSPGQYGPRFGHIVTEEIMHHVRLQRARDAMSTFKVTAENLEQVEALLKASTP